MKKISLLLLCIPFYTFCAENLKILELDSGSCWIEESTSKIVSFGDNKSFTLDEDSVENIILAIATELQDYKIDIPKKWKLYLHCNSFATHLVFKFQGVDGGICAWVSPEGELDFLGNFKGNKKGLCNGAIPGQLLVYGDTPSFIDPIWGQYIKNTTNLRKIILTKEYYFKEDQVIEKLKESFPDLKIERNYMLRRVGEHLRLRSSELGK
ncbi:MAG: hypothetical protein DRQ89_01275 [Epsilonproteobacteria bacterium]|nr:MAG: hypothetical protein DRQ89_01275 [Campylobacterota bacterium]